MNRASSVWFAAGVQFFREYRAILLVEIRRSVWMVLTILLNVPRCDGTPVIGRQNEECRPFRVAYARKIDKYKEPLARPYPFNGRPGWSLLGLDLDPKQSTPSAHGEKVNALLISQCELRVDIATT